MVTCVSQAQLPRELCVISRKYAAKACYGKAAAYRVTKRERLGHLWLVGAHPWHQTVATSLQTVSRRDIPVLLLGQLAMPELQSATGHLEVADAARRPLVKSRASGF